ncbi:hypothetical protein DRN97_09870 [Methanosarcinales archaeon]|nr:MAG: hypothetical protein DRN97_09870 [Methanosarcinales archaeon]
MNTKILVLIGIAVCTMLLTSPILASNGYSKIYGNANEDDTLDMRDVTYIKLVIFGKKPATTFADANYDGKISMLDIGQTKLIILGKEKKLTLLDVSDRTVTVPRPIERIVSLSIDDLRTLAALDAVDKIVARPDYVDKYADKLMPMQAYPVIKEIPSAGPYKDPNLELIVSLKPDVIFAYGGSAAYIDVANEMQDKTGIPVVCVKHSTESGYKFNFEAFKLVGKVIDEDEKVKKLISYANDEIAKVSEITSEIPDSEKPRVYFFSAHRATFIERAVPCYGPIDLAGGINVAEELPGCSVVEVAIEQIIIWNPDIILIHSFSKDPKISVESVLSDPRLQTVNAVKNKSVYYTKGFYIGWDPCSGIAETFYLAKLFHPTKFENLDVEKEGNEIYKEFYGVDGLYTYMLEYVGNYCRWD